MDIEKMRKWLEITNEHKKSDFWTRILEQKHPDEFLKEKTYQPKLDMYQNEYYSFIIFEIPGINREDLSINLISNTQLSITGKIQSLLPLEKEIKRERVYGEFERVVDLLEPTQAQLMHIQMYNGLLQI